MATFMRNEVYSSASSLLKGIGDSPDREGLLDTPTRYAKAWEHWAGGYSIDPKDLLRTFSDGSEHYDGIVFQGNIRLYSHCEHHLAPFFGVAHIGYIPKDRIVGLSKLSRVLDAFARRLQVQERITTQVANALYEALEPVAVGVVLRCRHLCMESRGVQKPGTITHTSIMLGAFRNEPDARAEFLQLVASAESGSVL